MCIRDSNLDCLDSNGKYLGKLDFQDGIPGQHFTEFKRLLIISKNKMSFHSKDADSYFLGEELKNEIANRIKEEFKDEVRFGKVIQGGKEYDFTDISVCLLYTSRCV